MQTELYYHLFLWVLAGGISCVRHQRNVERLDQKPDNSQCTHFAYAPCRERFYKLSMCVRCGCGSRCCLLGACMHPVRRIICVICAHITYTHTRSAAQCPRCGCARACGRPKRVHFVRAPRSRIQPLQNIHTNAHTHGLACVCVWRNIDIIIIYMLLRQARPFPLGCRSRRCCL